MGFQSLVFVVYDGTLCTEEFSYHYYSGYGPYYPPYNDYKDCYKADGTYIFNGNDYSPYAGTDTISASVRESNNSTNSISPIGMPSASPTVVTSSNAPSASPVIPTSMPTPVPSQMPSYCYDYGYEYPFPDIYYPTSGPGCELSLGAGVSIAAIILWFISGIVLLFRKPRNRPIVKCCKPCAPCCDEATSYPGTYSSNISGATNTENADIRMVVNEVANL